MAITPHCDRCKKELLEPGALAFSPPVNGAVGKYHVCVKCWPYVEALINAVQPPISTGGTTQQSG